mgnify:CR=1 FL=1
MKKKNRKLIKYLGIIAILIVVLIAAFLIFNSRKNKTSTYTYLGVNGENYSFVKLKEGNVDIHQLTFYGILKGEEKQYTIRLRYGPNELQDISGEDVRDLILNKRLVYITQDLNLPELTNQASVLAIFEINSVLGTEDYNVFQIPRESTITNTNSNNTKLQVKDCKDITKFIGVIKLQLGNTNRIYNNNGCVVLEAKSKEDIIRVTDKLILHLLELF